MMEASARADEASAGAVPSEEVQRPTDLQLMQLAVRQAVPFIGFGIFDNMVMITVGDAIDATFGVILGFSTLAAAGFGQMVSDALGITLQGLIERCADKLGLPNPRLTIRQERLGLCKNIVQGSRTVGIIFGCFIGMFPLLFLEPRNTRAVDTLLEMLPAERRPELWAALESARYKEGDKIIERGSPGDYLHVITQGAVVVVGRDHKGREVKAAEVAAGGIIGELEFVTDQPCVADVIATSPVKTQRLSKKDFLVIMGGEGRSLVSEEGFRDTRYLYYRMSRRTQEPAHHAAGAMVAPRRPPRGSGGGDRGGEEPGTDAAIVPVAGRGLSRGDSSNRSGQD